MASLIFKNDSGEDVRSSMITSIIYEDDKKNKYTFGVDNVNNVLKTFTYKNNGDDEVDYSTIAKNFMNEGAIATLLGIGNNVFAIKAKTDKMPDDLGTKLDNLAKSDDVNAIKAKTDKMPDDLGTKLDNLAKSDDVNAIKAKTDKMPADLQDELMKLTTISNAINSNSKVNEAAKVVLENSFKKAIKEAGEDGSKWLENEIKEIVSQQSFRIPEDSSSPLSWDW